MWILPKQLHTLASVQDTEGLISDSNEQSQAFAQSCFLRSKVSPVRTWSAKWKRDSWTQHLSGRILRPCLGSRFVTEWTSSLEASLASHSVVQESEMEMKTPATSSPTFWTALEDADLPLFSLKTLKESCPQSCQETTGEIQQEHRFCSMSSENWREWVTKQRQEFLVRLKSAHLIKGKESSSWPTANWPTHTNTGTGRVYDGKRGRDLESCIVNPQNWPTASTRDHKDSPGMSQTGVNPDGTIGNRVDQLARAVYASGLADQGNPNTSGNRPESWRTPSSSDGEGGIMEMREGTAGKYKLRDHVAKWATPRAGATDNSRPNNKGGIPLGDQCRREQMFPTPSASDHTSQPTSKSWKEKGSINFKLSNPEIQAKWATPQSRDHKSGEDWESWSKRAAFQATKGVNLHLPLSSQAIHAQNNQGKLNPRWVETLMNLPVGWVMPSCTSPVTPQANQEHQRGGESWMTPECKNHTGYQISNGKKILRLGSQVIQNSASPVTIEQTNSDSSETELFQQQQPWPSELF